jgi:5-methylcytosine-specific restriction endonuclease McrA
MNVSSVPQSGFPALVLNADFRPLSYYPLSLWPWQEVVKAVFLERVDVVAHYDKTIHSPSFEMKLPSVISLRDYVAQDRPPAFTRFNVFLRDGFQCQYCHATDDLTFDHLIPRSKGGRTTWENIVTACAPCNLRKGGKFARHAAMRPFRKPRRPNMNELQNTGRRFPPHHLHESWVDYLYWDVELDA